MNIHLRFTPYDISGYLFTSLEWIADKIIVAYEHQTKKGEETEPHFHIYMETKPDIGQDTIRNKVKRALCIPTGGAGKNNKYYAIDWKWKDPSYICKYDDIRMIVGYTEPEILKLACDGKQKYLTKEDSSGETRTVTVQAKKEKISYDKEIIADLMTWYYIQKREEETIPDVKEIIREACNIVRRYHRGINIFKVRDYVHSVMFEGGDYADEVIKTIYKII